MDQSGITPNTSNQQLVSNSDNDSATALLQEKQSRRRETLRDVTFLEYMTVGILCFVNLINYMDRFTLAGVLGEVKDEWEIGDDMAGLLQTVFVIAYMVFAPVFGYFGDRYSRRVIMAFGVALWSLTTFFGSYLTNFYWFMVFRGMVGIGEASYSTIAPTIISDLFVGNVRSKMLAFFYFAIPVGSGLGYIVGSLAGAAAGNWRWGLRVTPFLGAIAVALITWVMQDPERGQAEDSRMKATSYKDDLKSLVKNVNVPALLEPNVTRRDDGKRPNGMTLIPWSRGKPLVWDATCVDTLAASHLSSTSREAGAEVVKRRKYVSIGDGPSFMLSTVAFTCVAFVTGALAWWGPQFIYLGLSMQPGSTITIERVSLTFGAITMVSGVVGVPMGAWLGAALVKRFPRAHPVICGLGLIVSAPAMTLGIVLTQGYFYAPFIFMFIGEIALNLNWAIVADMSLYVVVPPRRSTAEAFQILISHMFGDAGSPYLVGVISESLKKSLSYSPLEAPSQFVQFKSLQYALFVTCFVEVLGGIFFLLTAIYIVRDKLKVDRAIAEAEAQSAEPSHSSAQEEVSG